jgi:hypothetical protein
VPPVGRRLSENGINPAIHQFLLFSFSLFFVISCWNKDEISAFDQQWRGSPFQLRSIEMTAGYKEFAEFYKIIMTYNDNKWIPAPLQIASPLLV